jgi:RimJ/RimL family protein N-acetyltransferase
MATDFAAALAAPPAAGPLRLEPLEERHRAPLKAACAEDRDIWAIYPVSFGADRFDAQFDIILAAPGRINFAVIDAGRLVGMSAYLGLDSDNASVEIGSTYLRPDVRGTGLNRRLKDLMIGHAFASGIDRIIFRVDDRNARSKAAVLKLGAVQEGLLRKDRVTWTGHVRDTAIFSILAGEWS